MVLLALAVVAPAQSLSVYGQVLDGTTREPLPGATVYSPAQKRGTQADIDGFFKLNLEGDTATLVVSFVGYAPQRQRISRHRCSNLIFKLAPMTTGEVVLTGNSVQNRVHTPILGLETVTAEQVKATPPLLGEADPMRLLSLKPGISSNGEGSNGFYIRGGGPDQNLVVMDQAVLYNPSHLAGIYSLFNNDVVSRVDLYKGGFPANFGGRLSSVIDVTLREGDYDNYHIGGAVGVIASHLTAEGPITKGKSSFMFGARRTYFNLISDYINRRSDNNPDYRPLPSYYFHDYNLKLAFHPNTRNHITASAYIGRDVFSVGNPGFRFRFGWGNSAASVRWSRMLGAGYSNTISFLFSNYSYRIRNNTEYFNFQVGSAVSDFTIKSDYVLQYDDHHQISYGASLIQHSFGIARASGGNADNTLNFNMGQRINTLEGGMYLSDNWTLTPRWQLQPGIRVSGFTREGQHFSGLEPRISARYSLTENIAVKLGYTRMFQYLHLVTNSGASLPADIWYPASNRVKPQVSDQLGAGFSASLWNKKWLFSNELYYKRMARQIDFKDGAHLFLNEQLDTVFVVGKGWAYGSEFYLEKVEGRTTGWIGYTLSWTWRQFDEINQGQAFHPRYDRRNDLSIVIIHKFSKRLQASATWVYSTGNAVTLPQGRYSFQDVRGSLGNPPGFLILPEIERRNSYRMAPYHRGDVAVTWHLKPRRGTADLTFSIYNIYNRYNPYFIYFETVTDKTSGGQGNITGFRAKQVSLFPIMPSLTYQFKF